MRRLAGLVLVLSLLGCSGKREHPPYQRGLIILGIDGMDPNLLRQYMAEGKTPNLKAMAEQGTFAELGTTNPPQSPVAWSTFSTGLDSGGHGIYDFVHRDAHSMAPMLSTSKAIDGRHLCIGSFLIPLGSGGVELLRVGKTFWQWLGEAGVPSTLVKVAANFPPPEAALNETLSGMGTPDALGTPGTFQVFTEDAALGKRSFAGGIVHPVVFKGQSADTVLAGPEFTSPCSGKKDVLSLPLRVSRDASKAVLLVEVDGQEVLLLEKEWSEWTPVNYDGALPGIVRFYLRSANPLHLYASPVNLDPADPAMPISNPNEYAQELAADVGRFYTKEMEPDTKALTAGVLSEEEFLSQVDIVWKEHLAMLHRELERFRGGLLFFYFSEVDQLSHVYFRALQPDANDNDKKYAHVIPDAYAKADAAVGEVVKKFGGKYDILVMSDHGFAPYRTKVDLNAWLAERGYLALDAAGGIDWANTQVYAMGLNGLFVNQKGREAKGVVPEDEKDILLRRITEELENFQDPEDRTNVVTSVVAPPVGAFRERAPDLLVGYNKGYRSSDESATGRTTGEVLRKNTDKWSGDHCIDPRHVPGVLLSTRKVDLQNPNLSNFASTVLSEFGVAKPQELKGDSLWQKK